MTWRVFVKVPGSRGLSQFYTDAPDQKTAMSNIMAKLRADGWLIEPTWIVRAWGSTSRTD